jgi:hypothetical protein
VSEVLLFMMQQMPVPVDPVLPPGLHEAAPTFLLNESALDNPHAHMVLDP